MSSHQQKQNSWWGESVFILSFWLPSWATTTDTNTQAMTMTPCPYNLMKERKCLPNNKNKCIRQKNKWFFFKPRIFPKISRADADTKCGLNKKRQEYILRSHHEQFWFTLKNANLQLWNLSLKKFPH